MGDLLRFGGERADRAPALVRARRLDPERREALLVICMKCADLSSLVMDLPRADFWGYRIMMENLKQGERESRERLQRTTPTTREGALANYFAHQAGFLEHVVSPMFDTLTLFTTGRFRQRVLQLAAANLAAWRKGHGEAMMTRASQQREVALTQNLLQCMAGFLGIVVFIISRAMLLRKKMNDMIGEFRGSRNPYAAQALDRPGLHAFLVQVDRAVVRIPRRVLPRARVAVRRERVRACGSESCPSTRSSSSR